MVAFPGAETESREAMPDAAGHVDVAIVGGGVCGLALASALVRRNTSVRLWEQRPESNPNAGQGFILLEHGVRALVGLGLQPESFGHSVRSVDIRDRNGTLILAEPLRDAFAIRRGDLVEALCATLPSDVACRDCVIDDVDVRPEQVVLSSRSRVVATADVLVGCDGARSTVRRTCFDEAPLRKGRVDELLFGVADPRLAAVFGGRLRKWMDRERHLSIGGLDLGDGVAVVFLQFPSQTWDVHDAVARLQLVAEIREHFAAVLPVPVLQALETRSPYLWSAHDLDPLATIVADRVVLAGDAAQPLLPFTSQGVTNALTDARDLALALSVGGADTRQELLADYACSRRSRSLRQVGRGREIEADFFSSVVFPELPLALEPDRVI